MFVGRAHDEVPRFPPCSIINGSCLGLRILLFCVRIKFNTISSNGLFIVDVTLKAKQYIRLAPCCYFGCYRKIN